MCYQNFITIYIDMFETDIKTIVTFTISDDDARNDLIDILKNLGYEDAEDQSTMVNEKLWHETTIKKINEYCKAYCHSFSENDIVTIYYSLPYTNNGKVKSLIKKRDYYFDEDKDFFV